MSLSVLSFRSLSDEVKKLDRLLDDEMSGLSKFHNGVMDSVGKILKLTLGDSMPEEWISRLTQGWEVRDLPCGCGKHDSHIWISPYERR